jgi:hypothetical protein
MNILAIGLGVLCSLVLGGAGVSLFLLWRAHALLGTLDERAKQREEDNRHLTARLESLSSRLHELELAPAPVAAMPAIPRAGMNLNKRSQALRLHRQGERADQIASTLEMPRQEIDLLIKVHRIVLSNV